MSDARIIGLAELKLKLQNMTPKTAAAVSIELSDGAKQIAAEAKQNAPGDQGFLRQQIGVKKINNLTFEVISGVEYSPFMEFGTLQSVDIPPGLEGYAAQFKGGVDSGGLSAKEAIFAWCARQGIDESAWYVIFLKIMKVGVHPHPFFFPAVNRWKPLILAGVKKALADAV